MKAKNINLQTSLRYFLIKGLYQSPTFQHRNFTELVKSLKRDLNYKTDYPNDENALFV